MSKTPTRAELEAAADHAADALAQHREAERMAAVNALFRPQQTLVDLGDPAGVVQPSEVAAARSTALLVVAAYLGARPPLDPVAVLGHLAGLLGQSPEAVMPQLQRLAADPRLLGALKRVPGARGDADLPGLLAALLVARL